jgi:hypothetical protein
MRVTLAALITTLSSLGKEGSSKETRPRERLRDGDSGFVLRASALEILGIAQANWVRPDMAVAGTTSLCNDHDTSWVLVGR